MKEVYNASEVGFLKHEVDFIYKAINIARTELQNANHEYGDAVASSGGDWAFDDPGSQIAAMNANQKDKALQQLIKLSSLIEKNGTISYPEIDFPIVTYGSRIHTIEENEYREIYDLGTVMIPGLTSDYNVTIITKNSPIGNSLYGSRVNDSISWEAPNGNTFYAKVEKIDQLAVKTYYERFGDNNNE